MGKRYYKVLGKDMKSLYESFKYELNTRYATDKNISICKNGFHACENLYELVLWTNYRSIEKCRFFECTLGDRIKSGTHEVCSNSIILTDEIDFKNVDDTIKNNLHILISDKDWLFRTDVAKQGYGLETLLYDKDWHVREAVVKHRYRLDVLVRDKNTYVRELAERFINK